MKQIIKSIAFAVAAFTGLVGSANAGISMKGQITELWVNDGGRHNVVFLSLGQTYDSPCSDDKRPRYVILDLSDPSMEYAYSMALSAYMSGKEVNVWGDGACYPGLIDERLKSIALIKTN